MHSVTLEPKARLTKWKTANFVTEIMPNIGDNLGSTIVIVLNARNIWNAQVDNYLTWKMHIVTLDLKTRLTGLFTQNDRRRDSIQNSNIMRN